MKILLACERSQIVTAAFRKKGHDAFSCDIEKQYGNYPEWHIQCDVREILNNGWDMMICFPPCTYLTVSANKWFKEQPVRKSGALVGKAREDARKEAIDFFMTLINAPINLIAAENPIGIMSTIYRKPDQIIQPWMFGHPETKATCLWLKNLPKLIPTNIVEGRNQNIWKMAPSKDRSTIRSKTYQGIADAMADQWSNPVFEQQLPIFKII